MGKARPLPTHGPCPVCGSENPHGLGVTFYLQEDGLVTTEVRFREAHQGPPNHAHGGMISAVLDEAMGAAVWAAGYPVVATRLEVEYLRPVPLGVKVRVEAQVGDRAGKAVRALGRLYLPDGRIAAVSYGVYLEAPQFFEGTPFQDWAKGGQG